MHVFGTLPQYVCSSAVTISRSVAIGSIKKRTGAEHRIESAPAMVMGRSSTGAGRSSSQRVNCGAWSHGGMCDQFRHRICAF
jgi:hypothetical protein